MAENQELVVAGEAEDAEKELPAKSFMPSADIMRQIINCCCARRMSCRCCISDLPGQGSGDPSIGTVRFRGTGKGS